MEQVPTQLYGNYLPITHLSGITTNSSTFEEFMSGFDAIAPVTFYYENSPHIDDITKTIRKAYNLSPSSKSLEQNILNVSNLTRYLLIPISKQVLIISIQISFKPFQSRSNRGKYLLQFTRLLHTSKYLHTLRNCLNWYKIL